MMALTAESTMLSQEHMAAYQNNGVVRIKSAFSQEWLDEARRSIEFGRSNPGAYVSGLFQRHQSRHLLR